MLSLKVIQLSLFAVFISLVVFLSSKAKADNWDLHEASLKASYAKIREKEKRIYEIVQKKRATDSEEAAVPLMEQIKTEHKALSEMITNLDKERAHVRFEHPAQGDKTARKYYPYKLKSLEDFETEGGLDGRLNHVKLRMLEQYGEPIPVKAAKKECEPKDKRSPASVEQQGPERIKLSY